MIDKEMKCPNCDCKLRIEVNGLVDIKLTDMKISNSVRGVKI